MFTCISRLLWFYECDSFSCTLSDFWISEPETCFLCLDDTMVPKVGKKFEDVSKLFDHAAHNGSNYLNGHCFVSLMFCVPLWNNDKIHYHAISLGYRIWQKDKSKLQLAGEMIRIEVSYYEQKTFWSLCAYMVRSKSGIERMVNLINISYCAMKILPYLDNTFCEYRNKSVQEVCFCFSERIREQVFIATFVHSVENTIKPNSVIKMLKQWIFQKMM